MIGLAGVAGAVGRTRRDAFLERPRLDRHPSRQRHQRVHRGFAQHRVALAKVVQEQIREFALVSQRDQRIACRRREVSACRAYSPKAG